MTNRGTISQKNGEKSERIGKRLERIKIEKKGRKLFLNSIQKLSVVDRLFLFEAIQEGKKEKEEKIQKHGFFPVTLH